LMDEHAALYLPSGEPIDILCNVHSMPSRKTMNRVMIWNLTELSVLAPNLEMGTTGRRVGLLLPFEESDFPPTDGVCSLDCFALETFWLIFLQRSNLPRVQLMLDVENAYSCAGRAKASMPPAPALGLHDFVAHDFAPAQRSEQTLDQAQLVRIVQTLTEAIADGRDKKGVQLLSHCVQLALRHAPCWEVLLAPCTLVHRAVSELVAHVQARLRSLLLAVQIELTARDLQALQVLPVIWKNRWLRVLGSGREPLARAVHDFPHSSSACTRAAHAYNIDVLRLLREAGRSGAHSTFETETQPQPQPEQAQQCQQTNSTAPATLAPVPAPVLQQLCRLCMLSGFEYVTLVEQHPTFKLLSVLFFAPHLAAPGRGHVDAAQVLPLVDQWVYNGANSARLQRACGGFVPVYMLEKFARRQYKSRGQGDMDVRSRQPLHCTGVNSASKVSRMVRDALVQRSALVVLADRMYHKSDALRLFYCTRCHNFAPFHFITHRPFCITCDRVDFLSPSIDAANADEKKADKGEDGLPKLDRLSQDYYRWGKCTPDFQSKGQFVKLDTLFVTYVLTQTLAALGIKLQFGVKERTSSAWSDPMAYDPTNGEQNMDHLLSSTQNPLVRELYAQFTRQ
jgi:hypothetical protein